uniref:Nuclear nucleic acid-binding protein C1D n=1 Tax=Syphacia muris TaxID=451379 RepID=A0A0N5AAN1_9BILA
MGESPLIPSEVIEQLRRFNESIVSTEDALEPFLSQKSDERLKLTALEQSRCNLLSVFAINSFYWILLRLKGMNPSKNESLANELKRTQDYMSRLKTAEEKDLAPKINQRAAANFVRNALWEPKDKNEAESNETVIDINDSDRRNDGDEASETVAMISTSEVHDEEAASTSSSTVMTSKRSLSSINPSEPISAKKMKSEISESG